MTAHEAQEQAVAPRRGRPRKEVPQEELKDVRINVANVLHNHCSIPGCAPKWHLIEADELIREIIPVLKGTN